MGEMVGARAGRRGRPGLAPEGIPPAPLQVHYSDILPIAGERLPAQSSCLPPLVHGHTSYGMIHTPNGHTHIRPRKAIAPDEQLLILDEER